MWPSSSARRSAAAGSACSSTACTSEPNVAPTGSPAIGEGRSSPSAAGLGDRAGVDRRRAASSSLPTTSGSLATPAATPVTARPCSARSTTCAARPRRRSRVKLRTRARASPGARRVVAEPARVRRARATGPPRSLPAARTARRPRRRSAAAAPARPCCCPRARISIRCSGEATAFLVGAHQHDDLRLGAGDGDVEQPQPLARLLVGPAAAVVGPVGTAAPDVEAAPALGVVEPRPLRVADEPVADRGQVDDGVLQPLAGVDGDQLDRGGVGVEPAGPLGSAPLAWPRPPARAARSAATPGRVAR